MTFVFYNHRQPFIGAMGLTVINYRLVLFFVGILLSTIAVAMLIPALADLVDGHKDWQVFVTSSAVTLFCGLSLILTNRSEDKVKLGLREMFLLTNLSWLVLATFSALPFTFSEWEMSFTDSFFESMSGITTTGSTVVTELDGAPPGLLLWRAILQWLGGIGIIVMAMIVLPNLQVGGMQLFRMESSDKSDKALPRTTQNAAAVAVIYVALTYICALLYWMAGMERFDAIAHALTTVATGGFSTSDGSMGNWAMPAIHWIAIVFMLLGGMPFILYLRTFRSFTNRTAQTDRFALFKDGQVRWFAAILMVAILVVATNLHMIVDEDLEWTIRHACFNVISVMTGTGYASHDYGQWGTLTLAILFFLTFVGGCAGSTSCGIKIFRFQVLYATARVQIHRLLQPHGVFVPYYNGRPISEEVSSSVMSFFFLFMLTFGVLAVVLGAFGLDFMTAISGAATAIANVGPGLGPIIGPSGTFQDLPDGAKWALSIGMLLGRLELFTIVVLVSRQFWTR